MKHKKSLFLTLVMIAMIPGIGRAQDPVPREVDVLQAKEMLSKGAVMIDVRERREVATLAFDVENVIELPLSQLTGSMGEIPNDKTLVIVCQSGSRSRQASVILMENGFTDLVNMDGGMNAWTERGSDVALEGVSGKGACCSGERNKSCKRDGAAPGSGEKACCKGKKK